ncbi:YggS family pyridoxal phosphate-dependent enzyme [Cocleimonas sp. KMM 6892]|jgi:pyridoxal phosphate enzyme (YggS family)|uniref:YggS family pyridoxal phosphate-dependent enzyme n=1 Tax=unclassified Cocleimonas TaxID=2639732 RepID=UPI002DB9D093|nr:MULTISPECIES: YggS family pyridoxal phosphate-dependent enzyme [unclassified Cocleimonas]MEB8431610.1 YggS family pyridoxal phosphate-dependent enzyme [Cocleimonas sp. KMM 6892]MEC4713618.1 YggS family pyridoxal phosphate-dependent enzyme [Cocleimonas sp. KMM 6895]MEC4742949.1 YggS family pyridoxal phosphate-dependent enzyme [Cocleimonas sp. KMM 6896]
MTQISDNLQTIGAKLKKYSLQYNRAENSVKLLAVSKKHDSTKIREAYECGQRAFGENYVQELWDKYQELSDLDIEWHFIGPLQSNKTKKIAEIADWVHTIDRLKIAQRLNDQRPENLDPLSVCIQLNISGEESKSGLSIDEVTNVAKEIIKLPHLTLRGLMVIPAPEDDFDKQLDVFAKVSAIKEALSLELGIELDTLSMGMSNDIEAAIAGGSTMVRIGTAIFGQREY